MRHFKKNTASMSDQGIIEIIFEKLKKYPDIKFQKNNDSELEIYSRDKSGFDILIQVDQRENTLRFGTFHWHFDNSEEETNDMLNQLVFGLSGIARIGLSNQNSC